jgi:hypothetical protein
MERNDFQVAEYLLNKYKKIIKNKVRPSNTLSHRAEYAITRKEHFSFFA